MMLSYGTNVHPAEDLPGLLDQFDRYAVPVRERLGADRLGLGLWLPAGLAGPLAADPAAVARLRAELTARGLAVCTLNAFPYQGFHAAVVKRAVYSPQWTDLRRAAYTVACARVLAGLLPDDAGYGSISTLPLGWRQPWTPADDDAAAGALAAVTRALRSVAAGGRPIVLAVEPEPGCVLDTVADAVDWLAPRVDADVVGLCVDTCHLAVSFADPAGAIARVHAAGLRVAKVQVSAALQVPDPADPAARAALAEFAEPRYLHQVREGGRAVPEAADDLPEALRRLPGRGPWRVHYHVPLHAAPRPPLESTTGVAAAALTAVAATAPGGRPHLEVETYTWSVLPPRHRQDLAEGIAAELAFARDRLIPAEVPG